VWLIPESTTPLWRLDPSVAPPSKALATKERDQDRRKTILRAAVEVFARKGYHGCRIADVAREANVAYGLVYRPRGPPGSTPR
jgi:AcrR family transcriptional regulator